MSEFRPINTSGAGAARGVMRARFNGGPHRRQEELVSHYNKAANKFNELATKHPEAARAAIELQKAFNEASWNDVVHSDDQRGLDKVVEQYLQAMDTFPEMQTLMAALGQVNRAAQLVHSHARKHAIDNPELQDVSYPPYAVPAEGPAGAEFMQTPNRV